jgi:energy-coupling factor transporter transmembrane protein EcfT
MVGRLRANDARRLAIATAGVLLSKTMQLSGDVYLAMQSRGFRGEIYLLDDFAMRRRDWTWLAAFCALAAAAVWMGR